MKVFWVLFILVFLSCEGERPTDIGIKNGLFKPCADKSNSVSTQCTNSDHQMNAIPYHITQNKVFNIVLDILKPKENAKIITSDSTYIHTEFKTGVGWVDDVEFYINDKEKNVHFRSASRIGYSDFGTNKERMTELRKRIREKLDVFTESSTSY